MNAKLTSAVLCLLLLSGVFCALQRGGSAETEPNDGFGSAEQAGPGTHDGNLDYDKDMMDYYKFYVGPGQMFDIDATCKGPTLVRFTYCGPDQGEINNSGWLAEDKSYDFSYTLGQAQAGTYYVVADVTKYAGAKVKYEFTLAIQDQSDAGQAGDAGDTIAPARTIIAGNFTGWLADADAEDYYNFTVVPGATINCTLSPSGSATDEFRLDLYRPDGDQVNDTGWVAPGSSQTLLFTTSDLTGGNYSISVDKKPTYPARGEYAFAVSLKPQNDAGQAGDAGGTLATARTIIAGNLTGWLADDDSEDYYNFTVVPGAVINCTLSPSGSAIDELRLDIYRPDGDYFDDTGWVAPGASQTLLFTTSGSTGGNYSISVDKKPTYPARGEYSFTLALTPPNDAGSGIDAPDDINASLLLPLNGSYAGRLGDDDISDFYSFNIAGGQMFEIGYATLPAQPGATRFSLYRPGRDSFWTSDWTAHGENGTFSWMTNNAGGGRYYLQVEGNASYNFTLNISDQMDAGAAGDAGDDIGAARPVPAGQNLTGLLGNDDEQDYYSFNATNGTKVDVGFLVTAGTDKGRIHLYGPDKDGITNSGWVSPGTPADIVETLAADGTYYLQIEAGNNAYKFNVTATVPPGNDTVKPVVTISSPANGSTLATAGVQVFGSASDDVEVAKVEVSLTGTAWTVATGTASWTSSLTLVQGANIIWARATDTSGNTNTTSITVTVSGGGKDTQKPNVAFTVPKNGYKTNKNKLGTISGTASDNVAVQTVELKVNGIAVPVTGTTNWSASNAALKEGKNTLVATATDTSGNVQNATAIVTYEKPKPQPGFEVLFLVAAVALGLVMLRKRRA